MATRVKKPRVYKESEKVRHTTHWDIDYLSLKEVDALYGREEGDARPEKVPENAPEDGERLNRLLRRLPLGLVLLILVLLFGRFLITFLFM